MAKDEPEVIELTEQEMFALQNRIQNFTVTKEDVLIFGKVLHYFVWMQHRLAEGKMSIMRLKNIIFGGKSKRKCSKTPISSSEKNQAAQDGTNTPTQTQPNSDELINQKGKPVKKEVKGHGRIAANAYDADEIIVVPHATLKAGDLCPLLCGGKIYKLNPGIAIRVSGQSCAHVIQYEFDKLRCARCNEVFTADAPPNFQKEKYDAHFKAILVVQKYFMASPFYRQERYQKLLGFPLPDSTQWDLIESAADCSYPVLGVLEKMAANGSNINNDDTHLKIQEVMRANKLEPDKKRKGMFTTCIMAESGGYKICLYYSGTNHAGENLAHILEKRDKALPPIIQMCDALSANVPKGLKTILCNCIGHGQRKFTDIRAFFPEECDYVIERLALVYKHDEESKKEKMTSSERLAHHQKYSAPVMGELKAWIHAQFEERKVEPNGSLGKAMEYLIKHWPELTKFLSVSGAHLDNNIVERALKLVIRSRKNSMFHRTRHGAYVASLLTSLIATCELAGKNPIHYLTTLQEHKSSVFRQPDMWLPWNYELTLSNMAIVQEAA